MKRFTDTDIWDKEWFMKLSPKHKCLIRFIFDKCDNAGVWSTNWILATTYIGEACSEVDLDAFSDQVERMDGGKIFIPQFIEFQYGHLSESCKPHLKIISLLKKHNLYERVCITYPKGIETLEEKEEEEYKEKEKDEGGSRGKQRRKPNIVDKPNQEIELQAQYREVVKEVQATSDAKVQKQTLATFITDKKPRFIEPYADLWNISTRSYGVASITSISESRLKKFKTRIREPDFDFLKILQEIRNSQYLQGKVTDWKVDWDWIFENDTNYLKVIEGKYRNSVN